MDNDPRKEDFLFVEKTLFIIVIYKCVIAQSASFQSLIRELSAGTTIFIFDNSPVAQPVPVISDSAVIFYDHHPENPGVSAAYNEGFRRAKQLGKKWLFLLDQDSEFPPGWLTNYQKEINQYPGIELFTSLMVDRKGIVSPFGLLKGKGTRRKNIEPGLYSFKYLRIINSGLLISIGLFEKVNGYDERFSLDFSDLIFVEKLEADSRKFVLTKNEIVHSLSSENDKEKTDEVLSRFKIFCKSARLFKSVSKHKVNLTFILLPRSFKLCLLMKDLRFISIAIDTLFQK